MPLEVRELIIKATIVPDGRNNDPSSSLPEGTNSSNNGVSAPEEIINTCIERVLDILKEKNER